MIRQAGLAITALLTGAAPAAATELVQRPQGNVTIPGSIAPDDAPDEPAAGPDERPLWRLLSIGELDTLSARVSALRTAYPGWQPPARMLSLLQRAQAERDLTRFKAAGDWISVRRLTAARPELASCARPDDAAVVAAAPGAASTLASVLASCPDEAARVAVLGAAFDRFGPVPDLTAALDRVDAVGLPAATYDRVVRLRTDVALRKLGQDLAGNALSALERGNALRNVLAARREGGMQAGLGWMALKAGRPAEAVAWFEASRRSDPGQSVSIGLARALLATGNEGAARTLLAATPGGAAMLAAMDDAHIDTAFRRGDFATAARLAALRPDPPATLGWSLLRLHRFDEAAAAFEVRFRRHDDPEAARGLVLALTEAGRPDDAAAAGQRLGGAVTAALQVAPTGEGPDLGYRLALLRLRRALDRKDDAEVARLAAALADPVRARGDADGAAALGWAALRAGHPAEARTWFAAGSGEDAAYGAALARLQAGDSAGAAAEAAGHEPDARWHRLRLDAMMATAQAREATNPGDPEAAAAVRAVLAEEAGRRDAVVLLGWNAAHAGRRAEGAAIFEALYRQAPDIKSAAALATTADRPQLDRLDAELGGPLDAATRHRAAQDAIDRKEFLAAEQLEPGAVPTLDGIGAPTVGVSGTVRSKSGESGTSRLHTAATDVFASATSGTDRVTVRLHLLTLDAGHNPVAGTTTRLSLAVEPSVSWVREATDTPLLSYFATMGTTPLAGRVALTPVGRAGVGWQANDATLRGTVFRESVTESLLSFTGITDGTTGRTFGRVTETGGKVEGYLPFSSRWGLYGMAGAGVRDGVGVRSNSHVQAAASLSYDLRVPGFDTLTLGPSYGFSAFGRDVSGFTPGQGGYYSPRTLHLIGAALRLLTREGRDFSVRASAFAGLQMARSDGPADGQGGRFASSRQDGFNATGEVTAAYRLSERWILGGMARYQVSPQYNDVYAGLSLTRSFGARSALFSADLPKFDLR